MSGVKAFEFKVIVIMEFGAVIGFFILGHCHSFGCTIFGLQFGDFGFRGRVFSYLY